MPMTKLVSLTLLNSFLVLHLSAGFEFKKNKPPPKTIKLKFNVTHAAEDSVMKEVSVAVDGEEARISFVDHMHGEMSVS